MLTQQSVRTGASEIAKRLRIGRSSIYVSMTGTIDGTFTVRHVDETAADGPSTPPSTLAEKTDDPL